MEENIELSPPYKSVIGTILSLKTKIKVEVGKPSPNNIEIKVKQNNGQHSIFYLDWNLDVNISFGLSIIYNTLLSSFQKGNKVKITYEEKNNFRYISSVKIGSP
ncbi:hypothetical protein [Photorhabdus sp. CRCIA-P01]|uniref:hypothetical protein n=1 Tax=Photorhabdus sp. CRCIA-P01 TaxID=2019570 RepID=UPI000E59B8D6|nr:hypothetical protein [Photorhabdus sp. CRCIA-P01]